jgi:hypothetical protein
VPAYYASTVDDFLAASTDSVLALLVKGHTSEFSTLEAYQVEAWRDEITVLRQALSEVRHSLLSVSGWGVLLEFRIPRIGHRIDAVVLAHDVICVVEFKAGTTDQHSFAVRQVEDYALELADFHHPSYNRFIVPIVVSRGRTDGHKPLRADWVQEVRLAAPDHLGAVLTSASRLSGELRKVQIEYAGWNEGQYRPVPTIIEAATALYAGASVREITHSHSGLENLTRTTEFVLEAVAKAQNERAKFVCFITGIPGAGKTLAGLNLVHDPQIQRDGRPTPVFMSGNGPLVDILREALAVDSANRNNRSKRETRRQVKTFVQNIHHYVQDNLERDDSPPPHEQVIVFDEAQRAWSAERNQKKHSKRSDRWHVSEPEMVLRIMDRHPDWAVVVALVGGGQEIHRGEAGLAEWGKTLGTKFKHWRILASPEALDGGESVAGSVLFSGNLPKMQITREPLLHLKTCVRAHRAEALATWVNQVLSGDIHRAAKTAKTFDQFPIVITRNFDRAKAWLRANTRGKRRCGLVASSGAVRLRAYGIETSQAIREAYSYPLWFLADKDDVRSSYQLETVATEFEIQGLELDNVGLCWGGDLAWDPGSQLWLVSHFLGKRWVAVKSAHYRYAQTFNKYRVLLTRSRQGLIIWVPRGDPKDVTRSVAAMDRTVDCLVACGATLID